MELKILSRMKPDLSVTSWQRVVAFTVLGTAFCIAVAFVVDGYSIGDGGWRWEDKRPLNNLIIPLILAPPFFFFLLSQMRQLAIAHRELLTLATTDSLTSLLNRRAFTEMADGYLRRIQESPEPRTGALLVVDVDHFKRINDRFGHETGDEALKLIARTLSSAVRDTDLVGRMGGEEFVVFLPGQHPAQVPEIAERIRASISRADFVSDGSRYPLSVSIGGVLFEGAAPFRDLYRIADEHLFGAKRGGRNRVKLAFAPTPEPACAAA